MSLPRGARATRMVIGGPALVLTSANVTIAAYLGMLTLLGLHRPQPARSASGTTRFAILVPAHDEAAVIADTMRSLRSLDYPQTQYEVHVVADNCTDDTATIVRSFGWHAHERFDPDDPGKGAALNWLFDRIDACIDADVVVIVDADTVLEADFLAAMDEAFAAGADAAQGFYSVRNPGDSVSAGIRFAALACRHHLRPLGRVRLGASCGLYGNGMAFRREILRRRRWSGHLVEDHEFQLELLLHDDIRVRYVPHARLAAEMPNSLEASTSQNERWERGRLELARRYVPQLLGQLPSGRPNKRVLTDAVADLLVPPLSTVVALQGVGLTATTLTTCTTRRSGGSRRYPMLLHLAAVGVLALHIVVGLRSVSAPAAVWRSVFHAPRAAAWKTRLWARALRPKNSVAWTRTTRNNEG